MVTILAAGLVIVILVSLVMYFSIPQSSSGKSGSRGFSSSGNSGQPEAKSLKLAKMEEDFDSLKKDMEGLSNDYSKLKREFEEAKTGETAAKEELARQKDFVIKNEEILNKIKKEAAEDKALFIKKEKELTQEYSKNVDFIRQLRESGLRIQALEEEGKLKTEEIEKMRHKIDSLRKELLDRAEEVRTHSASVKKMQKELEESEWIPKREFNKLNDEYDKLEKIGRAHV
jgi:chromosome segregation ATPase